MVLLMCINGTEWLTNLQFRAMLFRGYINIHSYIDIKLAQLTLLWD